MKIKHLKPAIPACLSLCAVFILGGCGGTSGTASESGGTVSGTAIAGTPLTSLSVTVKNLKGKENSCTITDTATAAFQCDLPGVAPYFLKAQGKLNTTDAEVTTLYSITLARGTTSINPGTTLILADLAQKGAASVYADPAQITLFTDDKQLQSDDKVDKIQTKLVDELSNLKPVFSDSGIVMDTDDPFGFTLTESNRHTGLDAFFDINTFVFDDTLPRATVTVTLPNTDPKEIEIDLIQRFPYQEWHDYLSDNWSLAFQSVDLPTNKEQVATFKKLTVNGVESYHADDNIEVQFKPILSTGDVTSDNTIVFGQIPDVDLQPAFVSNSASAITLMTYKKETSVFRGITHFESAPGALYLVQYTQDASGDLSLAGFTHFDITQVNQMGGIWPPSSGIVTSRNSHLGTEHNEPDARAFETRINSGNVTGLDSTVKDWLTHYYNISPLTNSDAATVKEKFNPYLYGYPFEIYAEDTPKIDRLHAAGRTGAEMAYLMPDNKTLYLTDGSNGGALYMFISDSDKNFGAGNLYAAKWTKTNNTNGGEGSLEWIFLGHEAFFNVQSALTNTFSDLFDANGSGCKTINTSHGSECLAVKSGMEKPASRLEPRRYAAIQGATTSFTGLRGIAFDSETNKLYVSASTLSDNRCGALYELDVTTDVIEMTQGTTTSDVSHDYVPVTMTGILTGTPVNDDPNNTCDVNGIANPSGLTMFSGYKTVLISEETQAHENSAWWSYNVSSKTLTRIATSIKGTELASPNLYPDVNGWAYIMGTVNYPYSPGSTPQAGDNAQVGYVGPLRGITLR